MDAIDYKEVVANESAAQIVSEGEAVTMNDEVKL